MLIAVENEFDEGLEKVMKWETKRIRAKQEIVYIQEGKIIYVFQGLAYILTNCKIYSGHSQSVAGDIWESPKSFEGAKRHFSLSFSQEGVVEFSRGFMTCDITPDQM